MKNIKRGDLVQLKSGGPKMVVYNPPEEYVDAMWMDISGHLNRASFSAETLQESL
jgi:uncharacterized protein YodC (DUF2158 family)